MAESSLTVLKLQPQKHRRVFTGHPWIYSNELVLDQEAKQLQPGKMVRFSANDGSFLGVGSFNPHCLIAGRIFSRDHLVQINKNWFAIKINNALALRQSLLAQPYYRLVHAEADGLPGLIIDRFNDHLGVQLNSAGMQNLWPEIEAALHDVLQPKSIMLHNDSSSRSMEHLPLVSELAYGHLPDCMKVLENDIVYYTDPVKGQKTGWYFDQRDNHALVAKFCKNKRVADLYCHAGGFGMAALAAGATFVLGVDSSLPALNLAEKAAAECVAALGQPGNSTLYKWQRADVFEALEKLKSENVKFDVVIADPPPFVKSRKDLAAGARGYRKLVRLSAQIVEKDGYLFIASCSHNMTTEMLGDEVARGLAEAKRTGRILYSVGAAPDHPVHPHLPETSYLKGFFIRLD